MKMITTSIRISKEIMDELESICNEEGMDKGAMIRKFLNESIRNYKLKRALDMYRAGRISLWKAAEMADITYREALEELRKKNIPFNYTKEDLDKDLKWISKQ
jgi:predicted HTH domain antitoxin